VGLASEAYLPRSTYLGRVKVGYSFGLSANLRTRVLIRYAAAWPSPGAGRLTRKLPSGRGLKRLTTSVFRHYTRRFTTTVCSGCPSGGTTRPAMITFPPRANIRRTIMRRVSLRSSDFSRPTLAR
jgi:hypothetical protein